jgi:hypothetical protein
MNNPRGVRERCQPCRHLATCGGKELTVTLRGSCVTQFMYGNVILQ